MDLNTIISDNYEKWVLKVSKVVPECDTKDVLHYVIVSLYNRNIEDDFFFNIDAYIVQSCRLAYYSKTSSYNKYKVKEVQLGDNVIKEDDYDTEVEDDIDIWPIIDEAPFSWWERELFKRKILEDKTFDELAKECNLSLGQVYYSYSKVRTWLKDKLSEKYNEL